MVVKQPTSTPKQYKSDIIMSSRTSQVPFELPTPPAPILAPKRIDEPDHNPPPQLDSSISTTAPGSPTPAGVNSTTANMDLTRFTFSAKVYRLSFLDQSNDVLAISTSTPKAGKIGDMFKRKRGVIITRTLKMLEGGERAEVLTEKEKDELWVKIVGSEMEARLLCRGDDDSDVKVEDVQMEVTEVEDEKNEGDENKGDAGDIDDKSVVHREAVAMKEKSLCSEYSEEEGDRQEISMLRDIPSPSRLVAQEASTDTAAIHLKPVSRVDSDQFFTPGGYSLPTSHSASLLNEYPSISEKPSTIGACSATDDYFSIRVAERRQINSPLRMESNYQPYSPQLDDVESQHPPPRKESASKLPMMLFWFGFLLPLAWIVGGWFCSEARISRTTKSLESTSNDRVSSKATAPVSAPSPLQSPPHHPTTISNPRSPQSALHALPPSPPATVRSVPVADSTASSKSTYKVRWLGHQDKWVFACRKAVFVFMFVAFVTGVVVPMALRAGH
ncbi:hypothetical protein L202_07038 [Cryptococcus amylolentus CBS 6039]|uniref:Uncharacterized protein n=1 Tax=Cryptococcus amylolentus CBS 6039 TaxID=1295533 RepID=A0A1E3HED5_9TREE|nr:hypothetical protein L202_07038 [Cryptococcus amylolentus CBS 6039]ODN74707.1 hypothetical protein L202_07038 [Cryptococcus amylolentus CBS 6039]